MSASAEKDTYFSRQVLFENGGEKPEIISSLVGKACNRGIMNKVFLQKVGAEDSILKFKNEILKVNDATVEFIDQYMWSFREDGKIESGVEDIHAIQGYALNWESKSNINNSSDVVVPLKYRLVVAATNAERYGLCIKNSFDRSTLTNKLAFDYLQMKQSGSLLIDTHGAMTKHEREKRIPVFTANSEFFAQDVTLGFIKDTMDDALVQYYISTFQRRDLRAGYPQ